MIRFVFEFALFSIGMLAFLLSFGPCYEPRIKSNNNLCDQVVPCEQGNRLDLVLVLFFVWPKFDLVACFVSCLSVAILILLL